MLNVTFKSYRKGLFVCFLVLVAVLYWCYNNTAIKAEKEIILSICNGVDVNSIDANSDSFELIGGSVTLGVNQTVLDQSKLLVSLGNKSYICFSSLSQEPHIESELSTSVLGNQSDAIEISALKVSGEVVLFQTFDWYEKKLNDKPLVCLHIDSGKHLLKGEAFFKIMIKSIERIEVESLYWLSEGYWKKKCGEK